MRNVLAIWPNPTACKVQTLNPKILPLQSSSVSFPSLYQPPRRRSPRPQLRLCEYEATYDAGAPSPPHLDDDCSDATSMMSAMA